MAKEVTRADIEKMAELAKAGTAAQLDAVLGRQREILAMDFEALHKVAMLMPKAANNGICGLGCSPATGLEMMRK